MAIGELFKNPLFLQYLSSAGGALSQGESVGAALNNVTQQSIASNNYAKLLKKMLEGGGKMTLDKDSFSLKGPSSVLAGGGGGGNDMASNALNMSGNQSFSQMLGVSNPSSSSTDGTNQIGQSSGGAEGRQSTGMNPFADLSPADLAGLTPRDISQALQLKLSVDELAQKKISDAIDTEYKRALIGQAEATARKNTPSISIPGTDIKLTSDQWLDWYKTATKDERTAAIKNYEYAQAKGYKGTFEQFQDLNKSTHQKDYQAAKEGGYEGSFNEWLMQMQKAGATRISIGEKVEQAEQLGALKGEQYFSDPKGLTDDLSQHLNSKEYLSRYRRSENKSRTKAEETIRFIEEKIANQNGSIEDVKWEGDVVTWTVKFPSGRTREVSYAVGPRSAK